MQDKKVSQEYVLLAVPAELLIQAGIFEGGSIAMHAEGNKLIIENDEEDEVYLCSGDCENCIMENMDCDGECEDCPCSEHCDESEV